MCLLRRLVRFAQGVDAHRGVPKPYGHVFAFTEDGKVVEDLQDPSGAYPKTTGVTETADRLYVQNLHNKGLGLEGTPRSP